MFNVFNKKAKYRELFEATELFQFAANGVGLLQNEKKSVFVFAPVAFGVRDRLDLHATLAVLRLGSLHPANRDTVQQFNSSTVRGQRTIQKGFYSLKCNIPARII